MSMRLQNSARSAVGSRSNHFMSSALLSFLALSFCTPIFAFGATCVPAAISRMRAQCSLWTSISHARYAGVQLSSSAVCRWESVSAGLPEMSSYRTTARRGAAWNQSICRSFSRGARGGARPSQSPSPTAGTRTDSAARTTPIQSAGSRECASCSAAALVCGWSNMPRTQPTGERTAKSVEIASLPLCAHAAGTSASREEFSCEPPVLEAVQPGTPSGCGSTS